VARAGRANGRVLEGGYLMEYTEEELDRYSHEELMQLYKEYCKLQNANMPIPDELKQIVAMYTSHQYWEMEEYFVQDFSDNMKLVWKRYLRNKQMARKNGITKKWYPMKL
jgi:hypothetical protein